MSVDATVAKIALIIAFLAVSCSKKDEPQRPPRPGEVTVELPVASVRFGESQRTVDVDKAPAWGLFEGALLRSGTYLPDTAYALSLTDSRRVLTLPAYVHFERGATRAAFAGSFDVSLDEGQEYTAVVETRAAQDSAAVSMTVVFRRPSLWEDYGTGTYRTAGSLIAVDIRRRSSEEITEYELTAPGFRRIFAQHADGTLSIAPQEAGCEGFSLVADSRDYEDEAFRGRFPIYSVASAYQPDYYCWLLNVTYQGAGTTEPRCDIVRMDRNADPRWEYAGEALFCDGWLLQAVSFEARPPLEPESNPWIVEMQRYRSDANLVRAVGIYRVASPLSALNAEPRLTVLPIALNPHDGTVGIAPSYSGFDCPGLFAEPFTIGGRGTYSTDAEGQTVITIPAPLHNAYGTYGDTWATVHAATLVINP